ncbi:MAG TPA: radical SAM protein [Nanoarchaeota archaeon]|nr:radical SAM protein [Nanoarchaeota archaeon]
MAMLNKPISIEWDLSYNCNFSCIHCRNSASTNIKFLPLSYYKSIIRKVSVLGAEFLTIGGGEPLLYPRIAELIRYGSSLGFKCRILSNGWFITESLVEKLKANDLWGIMISIDGIGKTHDRIRGVKGAFKRAVNAIKLLVRHKINVVVGMTLNSLNYKQIEEVIKLCHGLRVKNFGARPMIAIGRGCTNSALDLSSLQHKQLLTEIYRLKQKYKNKISIKSGDPLFNILDKDRRIFAENRIMVFGGCDIGIATLRIDPCGNVTACPALPNLILGNIFKQNPKEIWQKNTTLELFRYKSQLQGKCGNCKFKYICGGCRARANSNNNILGADTKCWLNVIETA